MKNIKLMHTIYWPVIPGLGIETSRDRFFCGLVGLGLVGLGLGLGLVGPGPGLARSGLDSRPRPRPRPKRSNEDENMLLSIQYKKQTVSMMTVNWMKHFK